MNINTFPPLLLHLLFNESSATDPARDSIDSFLNDYPRPLLLHPNFLPVYLSTQAGLAQTQPFPLQLSGYPSQQSQVQHPSQLYPLQSQLRPPPHLQYYNLQLQQLQQLKLHQVQQQAQQQQAQQQHQQQQHQQQQHQQHQQQQQHQHQQQLQQQQLQHQSQIHQLHQQSSKLTSLNVENPSSQHWQNQHQLCLLSRAASIPHYYARQYASNSRKVKNPYGDTKSASLVDATRAIVTVIEEQEAAKALATPAASAALLHNKKLATTVDQDQSQEEQRMREKTDGKQLWCQLDMSGQEMLHLLPKLFNYDFLESLYLNNNKLTHILPAISKLRGLRTLDLSHNRITEVPAQLGLCFSLRFLYLFDNQIQTLPQEFGNLIELLFLGIEGNPMDLTIANYMAEHGTKLLILHLRDSQLASRKPVPRQWLLLEDDGEIIDPAVNPEAYLEPATEQDTFTVMSYNMLCQHYATTKMYKYTPSWALNWEYRRNALQEDVLAHNSDIVCMQEVETSTYWDFWVPLMGDMGYKGIFFSKTRSKTMSETESRKVDGCATFYRQSKFTLIQKHNFEYNSVCMGSDKYKKTKDLFNRFMNKDNIALVAFLQHTETGERLVTINTHLHWDPAFNDVKALQVGILLEELQGMLKKFFHTTSFEEVKAAPIIICGDFNSDADSAVYQLFTSGHVPKHPDLEGRDYGRFTDDGFKHPFKLKSAYEQIGELPFTNFTPSFTSVIDYIWYLTPRLQVKGLLGKVDEEYARLRIGFPDANFPSDHIPLVTKFQIKAVGPPKKHDVKPDFKVGPSRKT